MPDECQTNILIHHRQGGDSWLSSWGNGSAELSNPAPQKPGASIIPLFVSPHLPERRLRSGPLLEAVLLRENLFRLEELLANPSTAPAGMNIKSEKPESPDHFEDVETNISDQSEAPQYDAKETQRILRKVDFRLLPMLTLLYVLSFIDRSNSEVILSLEVRFVLTSLR